MTSTTTPLISQDQALSLLEQVIQQSQAEGVFVSINAEDSALSRFSENQITQNLNRNQVKVTITSYYGKQSASAATTELDPTAIEETLNRSQSLAQVAPEDPEWVGLLPPQTYESRSPAYDEATANFSPWQRGEMIQQVVETTRQNGLNGSGTLSSRVRLQAVGNSEGLRACERGTDANFSLTARGETGSSWHERSAHSIHNLPLNEITDKVIQRAIASQQPRDIQPGCYPVIFDAAAFADLLPWVIWNLDARAADEGRSFMSSSEGGNRLGEQLFSPTVEVWRDGSHPLLQTGTFFSDGLPNTRLPLIRQGTVENLGYSRYWAQQKEKSPTGAFYPIVMLGREKSLQDLIAETKQGIFISRAWYVRYVNPRTLEVTGMTRDGTFWIENGELAYPIKNLRFNQNLPQMLNQVDDFSQVQRFGGTVVPGVRVKEFNFSSVTESI
jgi:predicted Zn-dependent protease